MMNSPKRTALSCDNTGIPSCATCVEVKYTMNEKARSSFLHFPSCLTNLMLILFQW